MAIHTYSIIMHLLLLAMTNYLALIIYCKSHYQTICYKTNYIALTYYTINYTALDYMLLYQLYSITVLNGKSYCLRLYIIQLTNKYVHDNCTKYT